jgi:hypothetical protein
MNREVAVYRGDEVLALGTIRECAEKLGVLPGTIYFYLMPSYHRRIAKRRKSDPNKCISVVRTDVLGGDD